MARRRGAERAVAHGAAWGSGGIAAVVSAGLSGAVLWSMAASHGINPDEGFYLAAGRRVLAGERLYADFFFPQMPYLPYLQAALLALGGSPLALGRLVSVVPGALVAGWIGYCAWRWSGRAAVVAIAAVACATHGLLWNYLSVIKTYGLANLFLVTAFVLLAGGWGKRRALVAGLSCGLALGVRLPALAAIAVLFLWVAWRDFRSLPAFLAGSAIALLPCAWIAAQDPQAFWFGNFGFHALRGEITGWIPVLQQKMLVLGRWVLVPQNLLLWILALAGVWRQGERSLVAFGCATALGAIYLSATPTYLEYTVQMIPFLLLAAIPYLMVLASRRMVFAGAVVVYGVGLLLALRPPTLDSYRGRKLELWSQATVGSAASYLESESEADDEILSWWEGYPVLANRPGFKGVGFWESNAAKKLPRADRERYHLVGRDELTALVDRGQPRLIVAPDGVWAYLRTPLDRKYRLVQRYGALRVYRRLES